MRLQEKDVPVYLISGGFRCIIEPIAAQLQIPMTDVFANELLFDSAGKTWLTADRTLGSSVVDM